VAAVGAVLKIETATEMQLRSMLMLTKVFLAHHSLAWNTNCRIVLPSLFESRQWTSLTRDQLINRRPHESIDSCKWCYSLPPKLTEPSFRSFRAFQSHNLKKVLMNTADSSSMPTNETLVIGPFRVGEKIQVEVISFGPLGASVDVIAHGSHDPTAVIAEDSPALGQGLILQREIAYFRQSRDNLDVVLGEILCAYVERVRENGRLDVGLRAFGGKAKASELTTRIMDAIMDTSSKSLPIGDKSTPGEIGMYFPGVSKTTFKRALATLYKDGKVTPGPYSVQLIK
jgi:hypothetical protein